MALFGGTSDGSAAGGSGTVTTVFGETTTVTAPVAQKADSTATNGNARGTNAVDWQTTRSNANQVASGTAATICGGANGRALGAHSAVVGGAGGLTDTTGAHSATVAGENLYAAGNKSLCLGGDNCNVTGQYSVSVGNTIDIASAGTYGFGANVNGVSAQHDGAIVHAYGRFAAQGDAQTSQYVFRVSTTNNTPTVMLNGAAAAVSIANDSSCLVDAWIVARRTDADGESAGYRLTAVLDRNGNAASTAIVGSETKVAIAEDTVAWDVAFTVDTTAGGFKFTVTGENSKTIRWVAFVRTVEVKG